MEKSVECSNSVLEWEEWYEKYPLPKPRHPPAGHEWWVHYIGNNKSKTGKILGVSHTEHIASAVKFIPTRAGHYRIE